MSGDAAVVVEGLAKSYGQLHALGGVSFEVARGEVFALLGPNGAGKTTTIEILEGFRARDTGRVEVLGLDPAIKATSRQLREQMGVVLQELAVEPFLSVRRVLDRHAGFYPRPRQVDEVLHLVGLEDKAQKRVKTLSGGQQRRLDLALGIIGDPELLILDEPTTGFDPSARRQAWELIGSFAERGTTVILTTHYLDEAEALASRVAVITGGRIVANGTPETLGGRDRGTCRIRFRLPPGTPAEALPVAADRSGDGVIEISTDQEIAVLATLTSWALDHQVALANLTIERLTLEDVYLRLVDAAAGPDARDPA
ncbi:MAG: ABC transporter ATP-binding protein [Acidimicrobiales bacterium]